MFYFRYAKRATNANVNTSQAQAKLILILLYELIMETHIKTTQYNLQHICFNSTQSTLLVLFYNLI